MPGILKLRKTFSSHLRNRRNLRITFHPFPFAGLLVSCFTPSHRRSPRQSAPALSDAEGFVRVTFAVAVPGCPMKTSTKTIAEPKTIHKFRLFHLTFMQLHDILLTDVRLALLQAGPGNPQKMMSDTGGGRGGGHHGHRPIGPIMPYNSMIRRSRARGNDERMMTGNMSEK